MYNISKNNLTRVEGAYPTALVDAYNKSMPDPNAGWTAFKGDAPMKGLEYKSPKTGVTYSPLKDYDIANFKR